MARIVKDFMIQGGDFVKGDGTGLFSIYGGGGPFEDENFRIKHTGPGLLSMVRMRSAFLLSLSLKIHCLLFPFQANRGANTNGCQFFITCAKTDFLDGKHVVFGQLLDGLLTLRKIENIPTSTNNKPKLMAVITECGEM